jgi:ComF family protein
MKYNRDVGLGEVLARQMIYSLDGIDWSVDLVMPVPIGPTRKYERGYNQAALLARPIALFFGWDYALHGLRKQRETRSQVGLTVEQRRVNVKDAFIAESRVVRTKRVLLVDDVTTSGATLISGAKALFEAGASAVYCLTLARAI